jgi:peptidoglycan/xylan/chitin deacetylase (PgdA/CDA1 family)
MEPQRYGPFPYTPIIDRPKLSWPGGARLALWVVPNIEFFPFDENVPGGIGRAPDVINWSPRDYGCRIGIFRIMEVLKKHGVRGTVALNSEVCDEHPRIIEECIKLDWEFMGHNQSNSRTFNEVPDDDQRQVVLDTFARIEAATGSRPLGWLGAGLAENWNTLDYLVEAGCRYVCDFVNDDQPYLMDIGGKQLVSIPYSSECNDFGAFMRMGRTPEQFESTLKRQFDVLYEEGAESGRVMAICIHPFLIGVPHRIRALDAALDYICGHDHVWRATGSEIIDHYLASGATF